MSGLQANINLLELQVKEAKLRAELAGLNAPPVSPADPKISAAPIVTSTVPGAVPLPGSDMPVVESVRGSGDTLVATIVAPGGTTVPATVGTVLPNGWRVTAIDNFGVAVARPDGQPGRLAFGTGRPASDLPQGGSFTRLPQ
jgi:type IV pilus biogenesis protein PilP